MSIKQRVERLKSRSGTLEGLVYFVRAEGDTFTLLKNGADITEEVELTEQQFSEWKNSRTENDCVYITSRREDAKEEGDD